MAKDWSGNVRTTWAQLGASNHTDEDREENDYYATDPKAVELLMENETFDGSVWENCCGEGHLAEPMKANGYDVVCTDLIDRGYGRGGIDFFKCEEALGDNIVTNPPYKFCIEWVEHSLELLQDGKKLALFLPLQFFESDERYKRIFSKFPPQTVYVASHRILCGKNGDFYERDEDGNIIYKKNGEPKMLSSAKAYAWFVWIK